MLRNWLTSAGGRIWRYSISLTSKAVGHSRMLTAGIDTAITEHEAWKAAGRPGGTVPHEQVMDELSGSTAAGYLARPLPRDEDAVTGQGGLCRDDLIALDLLGQIWGDAYDIGVRDDGAWWCQRKNGTSGAHTAASPGKLHSMINAGQVARLRRFREQHPDVNIYTGLEYWQATIPQASGETVITRYCLWELLDKLSTLVEPQQLEHEGQQAP